MSSIIYWYTELSCTDGAQRVVVWPGDKELKVVFFIAEQHL